MKYEKGSFLEKISSRSQVGLRSAKLHELIRVYQDLERTLRALKQNAERSVAAESINMRKLIERLSKSKRRLERKIGSSLLSKKRLA